VTATYRAVQPAAPQAVWDPVSATYQPVAQPIPQGSWDPGTATYPTVQPAPAPTVGDSGSATYQPVDQPVPQESWDPATAIYRTIQTAGPPAVAIPGSASYRHDDPRKPSDPDVPAACRTVETPPGYGASTPVPDQWVPVEPGVVSTSHTDNPTHWEGTPYPEHDVPGGRVAPLLQVQQVPPTGLPEPQAGLEATVSEDQWNLNGGLARTAEVAAVPQSAADQWVYVDPSAYSNPYTDAPVYTSGPQPIPTEAPAQEVQVPTPTGGSDLLGGFGEPQSISSEADGSGPSPLIDPLLASDYRPEAGELKIKGRRSWKTWHLVTACIVAIVIGMAINGNVGSASGSSASAGGGGGGYKLPPPSSGGSTATTAAGSSSKPGATTVTSTTAPGSTSTSTTTAGASTTTTSAAGASASASASTTTPPAALPAATVLVPEVQQTGNWTSPAFTIAGGTWNIGWAFQCVPAPAAPPTFQIFVVDNGAAPGTTPAVTSSVASGNSVTPLTSTGSQQVIVQTSAACRWAVKVTGSGS
jgi:hypothetical protein